jgi:hypothetical protein
MLEVQPKKACQRHSSAVVSGWEQGGTGTTWTTLHKDASYLTLNLFSFGLHFTATSYVLYDGLSYPCLSIFPQMLGLIPIPTVNITERQLQRMMLAGLRGAAEWGVKTVVPSGAIGGAWRVIDLRDGLSHSSSSFVRRSKDLWTLLLHCRRFHSPTRQDGQRRISPNSRLNRSQP